MSQVIFGSLRPTMTILSKYYRLRRLQRHNTIGDFDAAYRGGAMPLCAFWHDDLPGHFITTIKAKRAFSTALHFFQAHLRGR